MGTPAHTRPFYPAGIRRAVIKQGRLRPQDSTRRHGCIINILIHKLAVSRLEAPPRAYWKDAKACVLFRHVYTALHCHLIGSLFALCQIPSVEINLEVNEAGGVQCHPAPLPREKATHTVDSTQGPHTHICVRPCVLKNSGTGPKCKGQKRSHLQSHPDRIHHMLMKQRALVIYRSAFFRKEVQPLTIITA